MMMVVMFVNFPHIRSINWWNWISHT